MKFLIAFPVLATIAAFGAPALAGDTVSESIAGQADAKPAARLIAFTGGREFLKESKRLRVWRGEVSYRLDVDATGHATQCKLTETFRMSYVNDKLCGILLRTHSFEPAHDASGAAVEGTYEGRLNYLDIRQKD